LLFLNEHFEVLVDNCHSKQNSGTRSDRSKEIGSDREGSNAHSSESGSSRDISVEFPLERRLSVSLDGHLLVSKLLGNISSGRSSNLRPRLREESARSQDESDVDESSKGISEDLIARSGRRNVVSQTTNGNRLSLLGFRPSAQKVDKNVIGESSVQELRHEVQVGDQRSLKNDGDVAGVKELDGVRSRGSSLSGALDGQIDSESLEVNDDAEDENSGEQVGQVRQVLSSKSLLECTNLVLSGDQKMEESDDSSLEFGSSAGVNRGRRESLPYDGFADVGGNEERNTGSKSITLLQELIQQQDNDSSEQELKNDKRSVSKSKIRDISVHSRDDVSGSLEIVMIMPKSFWAPLKRVRSSLFPWSTSIILAPARSCITMLDVTMGEIPSSIRVPRLEAKITRIQ